MWQVQRHRLHTENPIIWSSHTDWNFSQVRLRKFDVVRLAILGNHLGGYVLRRPTIVTQRSQLLQVSRVAPTLGCCQCNGLDRWPLSNEYICLHTDTSRNKLDAAQGHSSQKRTAPREKGQGVRTLLLLACSLWHQHTSSSSTCSWMESPFTGPKQALSQDLCPLVAECIQSSCRAKPHLAMLLLLTSVLQHPVTVEQAAALLFLHHQRPCFL